MDVRALAFHPVFDGVLCPYSLVTYMVEPDDVSRLLGEIQRILKPSGTLVIDAFIPQAASESDDFRLDYRRSFGANILERSKRIRRIGAR